MDGLDDKINHLLRAGRKLEAIKICKENFNLEFSDAKAYVEELIFNLEKDKEITVNISKTPKLPPAQTQQEPTNIIASSTVSEKVQAPQVKKPKRMFSNLDDFEGRIRRTEYALSLILAVLASIVLILFGLTQIEKDGEVSGWIYFLYLLLCLAMWSQGARRCHDLGNSGWMQLVPFYFLWMIFQEGQSYDNEYGENPK